MVELQQPPVRTEMTDAQFAASHPHGIGLNYWHVARNRILWRRLQRTLRPTSVVMDIGCGPGIVVDFLRSKGVACYGSDLGTPTPETASVEPYLYLGQSAFELERSLRERVDTILLMDVVEHLPTPEGFLRDCVRAFPNAGTLHLTVPARMEIWSNYDEHFGHYRRYTRSDVAALAAETGHVVVNSSYAFHGLYAAARVAKLLSAKRQVQQKAPSAPLVHSVLGGLFALEQRLLPSALKGSSIFAQLTRKPGLRAEPRGPSRP